MIFTEFLECVKRAGLEGKFQYKEEWFDWKHKKIKFLTENKEEITQNLFIHLYYGFPFKEKNKKLSQEEFLRRCDIINIYNDRYDKVKYINNKTEVIITCEKHGDFKITPECYLRGQRCKYCGYENTIKFHLLKYNNFVDRANKIFNFKYIYDKVNLEHRDEKGRVCIICPIHGEFWITPISHLQGQGCKYCGRISAAKKQQMKTEEFIEKVNKIFNFKYNYSKTDLSNRDKKGRVCIICPEHGEFWIKPDNHLQGKGCAQCCESHNERKITTLLTINNIIFNKYKTFDWLKYKINQNLDFYLEKYNIAIECQGEQHFKPIKRFGGNEKFDLTIKRDINKFKLCQENGVKLLYLFPNKKVNFSKVNRQYEIYKPNENIFYSPEELIEYIKTQAKIKNLED